MTETGTLNLTSRPSQITTHDRITVTIHWDTTWHRPEDLHTSHVEHGHCAEIGGVPGRYDNFAEPTIGARWPLTWDGHPVRIDGITEDDMAAAVELLVDTARAYGTWSRLRSGRAVHTIKVLAGIAAERGEVARTVPAGGERWLALTEVERRMGQAVIQALRDSLVPDDEIQAAAELSDVRMAQLRDLADGHREPQLYVDDAGFAARLGILVGTLRSYKARGMLPPPDIQLGGSDGWLRVTVEAYATHRLRQGARTDLA